MTLHHSEETHRQLVERIPAATGRQLSQWYTILHDGPSFGRFDDRVNWLRDEYQLAHGHATAIVHEYDLQRAARNMS